MELEFKLDPRGAKSVEIRIEGEVWRRVASSLFLAELKKIPVTVSREEFFERFSQIEKKAASREVLRLLSLKAYLSSELEQKLRAKGVGESACTGAIQSFQERGFIDDRAKVVRLIEAEQRSGWGKRVIYSKLKVQKNIEGGVLKELLASEARSDAEVLKAWLQKRASQLSKLPPRKLMQKLAARGFDFELISALVQRFANSL